MHSGHALGKPSREYLHTVVYTHLGLNRREVIVGPRYGVDNAVIRIGRGTVMVATADPVSFIPGLGAKDSAWLSVNLLASDLATSGFSPQYGMFDFNLPPTMTNSQFSDYWRAFHAECKRIGIAVVGGHTGRYLGCNFSVIGGGVVWAVGPEDRYLTSTMGQNGDDIILSKGAAIETTAVLARAFPKTLRRAIGFLLFEKALLYLRKVSTVGDALSAVSVGLHQDGVTAMHDATEGGVIAAILELADASRMGGEIHLPDIPISDETNEICRFFRINPLTSLSEGSLVIAARPSKTDRILHKLNAAGIQAQVIGQLTSRTSAVYASTEHRRSRLKYPNTDPYWKAYSTGMRRRLK